MSRLTLTVLVRRAPEGIERLLGLLRRRAVALEAFTVESGSTMPARVVIRFGPGAIPPERLMAEISALPDVVSIGQGGDAPA